MNPTDPAFPCPAGHIDLHASPLGMDLRTYMATQFLAGHIAGGNQLDSAREVCDRRADWAALQADALIERLNAKP